jgi:hypothetical protein
VPEETCEARITRRADPNFLSTACEIRRHRAYRKWVDRKGDRVGVRKIWKGTLGGCRFADIRQPRSGQDTIGLALRPQLARRYFLVRRRSNSGLPFCGFTRQPSLTAVTRSGSRTAVNPLGNDAHSGRSQMPCLKHPAERRRYGVRVAARYPISSVVLASDRAVEPATLAMASTRLKHRYGRTLPRFISRRVGSSQSPCLHSYAKRPLEITFRFRMAPCTGGCWIQYPNFQGLHGSKAGDHTVRYGLKMALISTFLNPVPKLYRTCCVGRLCTHQIVRTRANDVLAS